MANIVKFLLDLISNQGYANQNYIKMPLNTYQKATIIKIDNTEIVKQLENSYTNDSSVKWLNTENSLAKVVDVHSLWPLDRSPSSPNNRVHTCTEKYIQECSQ